MEYFEIFLMNSKFTTTDSYTFAWARYVSKLDDEYQISQRALTTTLMGGLLKIMLRVLIQ